MGTCRTSDPARHADHHTADAGVPFGLHLLDEALNHLFRHIKVCNHPVFKRTDRFQVFVCTFMHLLRFVPDGHDLAGIPVDGNNAWFIQNDASAADVNQGVRGSKVNRHIGGKTAEDAHMLEVFQVYGVSG